MKKIKSIVSMLLVFVLVLACVQMLGVKEVEAAGASVTVYNAQYVPTSTFGDELKAELSDSAENVFVYIVNEATVVDVKIDSEEAIYARAYFDASKQTLDSSGLDWTTLSSSTRIKLGQDLKNNSDNFAYVAYAESTATKAEAYYVFISQSVASSFEISAQGTRTDNATCTMHRLYNPNSGEHFYTANDVEKNNLVSLGWKYEGTGWTAPAYSGTPVYRVYNPNAGDHHYTTNVAEKNNLVALGWNDEGIGWYSNEVGTSTLHRLYNPNATGAGAHHYTTNSAEATNLQNLGWRYEGTAWYGL